MAIDPMLYERVSGRSANPHKRLGEALADSEQQKARNRADQAQQQMLSGGYIRWGMLPFWLEVLRRVFRRDRT